jgi:D-sedoheptulose 7-phosphate isomerase
MNKIILESFKDSILLKEKVLNDDSLLKQIDKVAKLCIESLKNGNKILLAGNGGSAADAQHFAAELVGRFYLNRPGLAAIALTTDTSIITSIGNDFGYDQIFKKQIEGLGKKGDIFFAISTSGNSENIMQSINVCKDKGITIVGLTGKNGGKMNEVCDINICIPGNITPRIQECHGLIIHIICEIIETEIFG